MANRDSRTQSLTANLAFHTFAACLGGFSAGLNLGNLNTPGALISQCNKVPADKWPVVNDQRSYLPCWEQDPDDSTAVKSIWGTVCSLLAVGGFVGALLSTELATRLGRKYAIMAINLLFVLGGLLMALSNGPVLFGFGRFFSGLATGAATSLVSMYVNEIATEKIRGSLGACLQLNVVIGIMVASIIGQPLSQPAINENNGLGWRIIVVVVVIPAVLQVISMFLCVETPSYLISKGRLVEAKTALQKLRGHEWNVDYEYADILKSQGYANDAVDVTSMKYDLEMKPHPKRDASGPSSESTQLSIAQVLKHPKMRKMLFIAIGIHLCQQMTGINSIITYSTEIFRKAYADIAETLSTVVMLVNLLATFPSLYLVEKLGRKSLLFYGLIGMTAGTAMVFFSMVLNVNVLVIVGVLTYIVFFAVGLGPIPFLIIPELFPTKGVAVAAGLANFVNYFSNFLVVLTFPMYETPLGNYVFIPFLALSALGAFFVFTCVPETKGKTLTELGYTEDD